MLYCEVMSLLLILAQTDSMCAAINDQIEYVVLSFVVLTSNSSVDRYYLQIYRQIE